MLGMHLANACRDTTCGACDEPGLPSFASKPNQLYLLSAVPIHCYIAANVLAETTSTQVDTMTRPDTWDCKGCKGIRDPYPELCCISCMIIFATLHQTHNMLLV